MMTFLNGKIRIEEGKLETDIERDDRTGAGDAEDVLPAAASNGALDGMESLLLALVQSGVITQSEDPRVNESLQTALDAISNNL